MGFVNNFAENFKEISFNNSKNTKINNIKETPLDIINKDLTYNISKNSFKNKEEYLEKVNELSDYVNSNHKNTNFYDNNLEIKEKYIKTLNLLSMILNGLGLYNESINIDKNIIELVEKNNKSDNNNAKINDCYIKAYVRIMYSHHELKNSKEAHDHLNLINNKFKGNPELEKYKEYFIILNKENDENNLETKFVNNTNNSKPTKTKKSCSYSYLFLFITISLGAIFIKYYLNRKTK